MGEAREKKAGVLKQQRMLSHAQARRFYDRFGKAQETQRFYEEKAIQQLIAAADFGEARRVVEMGCGTGRLAEDLLEGHLPKEATLLALDLSSTMVRRTAQRLERFGQRAKVRQTDGSMQTGEPDGSCDRLISTYLLDLLSPDDISAFLCEASRLLTPEGRLALAGLTPGYTPFTRLTSTVWRTMHRLNPLWVGGCRPLELLKCLPARDWELLLYKRCRAFGIPSEVAVCRPRKLSCQEAE